MTDFKLDEATLVRQFCLRLRRVIGYHLRDPRVTDIAGLASVTPSEPSPT